MHKMKDRSSKNKQKGSKANSTTSNSGQSNQNQNKNKNESTVKSAKQQKNTSITQAAASTEPEIKNATKCDSGESLNVSQNGNVVPTTKVIKNYSATTPTSDETDISTRVDSNCNNISVDTTPNRDIKSDVDSAQIVKSSTSHLEEDDTKSNIATSTQNAQPNQLSNIKFQSNFQNQIMQQMKSASTDVPQASSIPLLQKQSSLTYSDGQWSPNNADGKKFYNRDQLIMLRNQPASQFVPNLPGPLAAIAKTNQHNVPSGSHNNFLPKFAAQGNFRQSSSSQRNSNYSKRSSQNSMQQSTQNGNYNKGSKTDIIHMSLSLHDDVKLNETENAWTPSFLKKESEAVKDPECADELLYKRVRGVLNKLTPERFDTLFDEIKNFNIDTVERLHGVILLVFEKAIDEPNFSVAYAQLCNKLSESLTKAVSDDEKKTFKKTLITKCQQEFDQHVVNEKTIAAKLAPFLAKVNETDDVEKKAEYQASLEEAERKLRRRSVGTVRFIGELYKIEMLTPRIMMSCIRILLDQDSEDKLECLCKLLATIGANLEDATTGDTKSELNNYFRQMQMIVDKKIPHLKISSRVRFMLQDVIDLRKNKWIPRRNDVNPKTMGQIQKEAEDEQQTINLLNYNVSGRRDDRGRNDNRMNTGYPKPNRGSQGGEDGWSTSSKSRSQTHFDPSKFKSKTSIDDNTQLGVASQFKWNQSSGTSTLAAAPPNIANSFAALDRGDSNKSGRDNRSGRGDNYHSKGSMERYQYGGMRDRRGSRSGSQQRSRENSLARNFPQRNSQPYKSSQSMHAIPSTSQPLVSNEKPTVMPNATTEPTPNDVTKVQKFVRDLLENHHIGEVSLANCHIDVDKTPLQYRWVIVREIFNTAVEVQRLKASDRTFTGKAINQWIKMKLITVNDMLNGLKSFLEPVEDIAVDIPHIWLYIAEGIAPLIESEHLNLRHLKTLCPDFVHRILEDLLPYLISNYGSKFVKNLLHSNELSSLIPTTELISTKLKNIVASVNEESINEVATHKQTNNQESVQGKPLNNNNFMDDIQRHIKKLLTSNTKLDDIYNYISANVTTIDDSFIRALTTAVVDSSLDNRLKLNDSIFKEHIPLIERYLDGNEQFELQCLIAIQILINRLEHPQGLMQNIFSVLVTERIVSAGSIMNWKSRNDVMEGKDAYIWFTMLEAYNVAINKCTGMQSVAVAYLRSFFDVLDEMEKTGEVSSEDDDN